ncbi:MAG: diacylglycerol kinase [Pontibacterium sp.]
MDNQEVPPAHTGIKRIMKASQYSMKGLAFAWKSEAAFRQEVVLFILALVAAFALDVSTVERVLLILSVGMVIVVELLNSAVEACVDRIGPEYHKLSGAAKDIGSAAVLISLLLAGLTWILILFSRLT